MHRDSFREMGARAAVETPTFRKARAISTFFAVVGGIGAVAFLALTVASCGCSVSHPSTTALNQVGYLQQAVRELTAVPGAGSRTFTQAELLGTGHLRGGLLVDGRLQNVYGGSVRVWTASSNLSIAFGSVPRDECRKLISKNLGRSLVQAGTSTHGNAVNAREFEQACSGRRNEVIWTFRVREPGTSSSRGAEHARPQDRAL